MDRPVILSIVSLAIAGCGGLGEIGASPDETSADPALEAASAVNFGDPLPGLTADELARFQAGKTEFEAAETVADGLGPVFNDVSCVACHFNAATGGGSTTFVTRFGTITDGVFDGLPQFGGSLINAQGIGQQGDCNYVGETVPPEATITARRHTPPLFGFGFLDAVPDIELRGIAAFEARFFPETAGRVAIVHNIQQNRDTAGKFGFKAMVPSVHQFAGDAYVNEMGITNPEFPNESCPQGNCALLSCNPRPDLNDDGHAVVAFTDFMTMVAPPARGEITQAVWRGRIVFAAIGCNHCHWSTLVTDGSPVGAIRGKFFHPFTDLLLHDMGSLGDGISLGSAGLTEMRTTPLWGLRVQTEFLHDGRAKTLPDAIAAHDGQGADARDRFLGLPSFAVADLLAFLNSL